MVFDKQWFLQHQKILLWFLNTPLISLWFRWVLGISGERSSVLNHKILKITPNAITWKVNNLYYSEFRTHDKFSKRLYFAFLPMWQLMHLWDMYIANSFFPKLNLGFDTLTVYPGESGVTVDGRVLRQGVNESFATIRAGAGTTVDTSSGQDDIYLETSNVNPNFISLHRTIQTYDTSDLTGQAVLNSASISLYGNAKQNTIGDIDMTLAGATPASNSALVAADYSQVQNTSFGSILYSNFNLSAYNAIALNSDGKSNISLTGISKFSIRATWDINNSFTGSWISTEISFVNWISADGGGTSQDPYLTVIYYYPQGYMI